jgi:hypothetical protein
MPITNNKASKTIDEKYQGIESDADASELIAFESIALLR